MTEKTDAHRALERFALAGRRRRETEREREARRRRRRDAKAARVHARAARREARDVARRRARSTTRAGVFTHTWLMVYLAVSCMGMLPMLLLADTRELWLGAICTAAALPLLGWLAAVGLARRGLRREVRWARSRGFPVTGHVRMLGAAAHRPKATLEFVGDGPTEGLVRDVITAAALAAPPRTRRMLLASRGDVEQGDSAVRIAMPSDGHGLFQHDNFAYRRWLHAVVDRVAAQVHPVYPVARVAVSE